MEPRFHITGPWPDLFDPRWILFDLEARTLERFHDRQAAVLRKDELEREAVGTTDTGPAWTPKSGGY